MPADGRWDLSWRLQGKRLTIYIKIERISKSRQANIYFKF